MNNVLLYLPESGGLDEQILRVINPVIPDDRKEIYRKIDALTRRLLQIGNRPSVAVVLSCTRKEFEALYSIRELFSDLRTLLILPDRGEETIAKGHAFFPRFLGYVDGNLIEVASVLEKMLMHVKRNHEN